MWRRHTGSGKLLLQESVFAVYEFLPRMKMRSRCLCFCAVNVFMALGFPRFARAARP